MDVLGELVAWSPIVAGIVWRIRRAPEYREARYLAALGRVHRRIVAR